MQRSTASGVPAAKINIHNLFPTVNGTGNAAKEGQESL